MPRRARATLTTLRRLVRALPGVEEGPCYGTPGFRVGGKVLARLWEDGETLVVKCGDEERDYRLELDPKTYFVTDHYRGYPSVLVRLSRVRPADLRAILERAWYLNAPKRLIAERKKRTRGEEKTSATASVTREDTLRARAARTPPGKARRTRR